MTVFLVERYLSDLTRGRIERAGTEVADASGPEGPVRYLGSILVPGDDASLCLFEAAREADLATAVSREGTPFERIVKVEFGMTAGGGAR